MSEDKKDRTTTTGTGEPPPPSWPLPAGRRPRSGIQTVPGAPALGNDPDFFAGQELGGHTIKRKLAEDRMSVLYEGEPTELGRRGAIKVLKLEFCRSDDVIERFFQVARAVNSIRHENIVDVYDFGRDPYGRAFFVMEYLEGEPLSSRIHRGALPWSEAFPILEQTLRALKAAHDKGFVHRALKPDNIWLKYVEGGVQVKLLGFGIAKLVGAEIGASRYMSPEQIDGSKASDHRTDIYAMGVITYEMFAGVMPFDDDTPQATRLADLPMSLGVPASIAEIVERMLVKDATDRYESVAEVLADLHDANGDQRPPEAEAPGRGQPMRPPPPPVVAPVPMRPPPPPVAPVPALSPAPAPAAPEMFSAEPRVSRRRAIAITGAAITVVAIAIAGVAIWKAQQQEAPETPAVAPSPPPPVAERPLDHDAIRKDAQEVLRASLRESEPAVRMQGSEALGKIRDQPSVPALTELAEKDPDPEVRGHAAAALGMIGAPTVTALLVKLEAAAPSPLKVWYAAALARLGGEDEREHLLTYAHDKDLAVSFKAVLSLADVSPPGDLNTIAALQALALHEAELAAFVPHAGPLLLTRMTARHDASARKRLRALLDDKQEGTRLAAAEGLAKLGDDAGKKVLQEVLANAASPNRLAAAAALISLGEYGGLDLITAKLVDKDPGPRRLAARALGEVGEHESLRTLLALANDKDWTVRIAAAAALVAIVGLDPKVLAQASVDWTKLALDSQDRAVRKAAAGVLADLPEKQAVLLLAQAIADPDPDVRFAAAKSAGRMRGPEVAAKVAARVKVEADPGVKEQQVKALGEIGSPAVRDTLAQISEETSRIGVIAAGSLLAVGDTSGKAKLETAAAAPQPELRLAAVQAAAMAKNPIVVPMLKTGVADPVFDVRFTAAEGLAAFNAEREAAVPVLTAALVSKDARVLGRAMAALLKFDEKLAGKARTPAEMLDSADPKLRLAAVSVVRAMPVNEGVPLLRRLVADLDPDVRRVGVDAIEGVVPKAKDQAIKLYKPLVGDADPVVRSKASGQLARLIPLPPSL
ncbi:MAG TPA: HEAT repeat domain-containing protein [Kofleriaceae bacterium]|nr:HEAT repeat domain-containing protein [Kofleriaceae bacterium]